MTCMPSGKSVTDLAIRPPDNGPCQGRLRVRCGRISRVRAGSHLDISRRQGLTIRDILGAKAVMVTRPPNPSRKTVQTGATAQVCEVLRELLPTGDCSVEAVAKRFSIDRRSVLRRLKSDGTTYSNLLKQVRSELLEHYVENTDLSLTEIAHLLSFKSLSALSRWKRSQPRQSQREEPSAYNDTLWMESDMYSDIIHFPEPLRKRRK